MSGPVKVFTKCVKFSMSLNFSMSLLPVPKEDPALFCLTHRAMVNHLRKTYESALKRTQGYIHDINTHGLVIVLYLVRMARLLMV